MNRFHSFSSLESGENDNVYNNNNVAGISYNYNSTRSSYANDLPILPSLGLRVEM